MSKKIKVLFVCLGNICRSPTADGIFRQLVANAGLQEVIQVDSAGTGDWHIGKAPDARTQAAAKKAGYDLSHLRARQVKPQDLQTFDYVLAMDEANLAHLRAWQQAQTYAHVDLFLSLVPETGYQAVPDPYYGGPQGFDQVVRLVEIGSQAWLTYLIKQHKLPVKTP
ncbi:protein-tyrosine phosphatase [Allopseudospirillum japonicum]|uniref:protein-tyrosine-phosphatase n=1 Tax=Allopseudospirillum japonicum TaxID=64971 RepID=A0A1H6Q649_9GAMM|nr:low molecular weight protein-tyrosine-phosphatase [Allopseudospirillum japonicum]SEI39289.1 protein-tyrosine phosphatase [Allopseudospirillum japonicum]